MRSPDSAPPRQRFVRLLSFLAIASSLAADSKTGRQFVPLSNLADYQMEVLPDNAVRFTSPVVLAPFPFDQLIVSWNLTLPPESWAQIEAQPLFPDRPGRYYTLAYWSPKDTAFRRSVPHQSDSDGEVLTDVVALKRPAHQFRIRLTLFRAAHNSPARVKFLAVTLLNSSITPPEMAPPGSPTHPPLPVPTRSQLDYAGGAAWCSPTALSMVLSYWAARLERPDLDRDVPEVAAGVNDPAWPGTGNWAFNTAYAGSFPGMRAYVARLAHPRELEPWIAAGVPVIASITYSVLKGQPSQGDGHLVVVVGFDENGDVILNDPGSRIAMRKTVPLDRFDKAWAGSHKTVYLVHPEDHPIPASPHHHW